MRKRERGRGAFWESAYRASLARGSQTTNARACRQRRAKLRAAGLCVFCGQRPALSLCPSCKSVQSTQRQARYKARVEASGRKVRRYRRRATA